MVHALLTVALGGVLGESVNGMFGYENGVRFYVPVGGRAVHVGRVDFGGAHHGGRARLDLSGAGCSRVRDWSQLRTVFEGWVDAKLTRVDLAVDALEGEFSVDDAVIWYESGDFRASAQGAQPRHSLIGDWLGAPKHGRTIEVGRRENGKMCRVYEKGRQLGDQASAWTRFEVELRNNDRDLPWDVLTECDKYFAGAYRCLEQLIGVVGERIKTHQKEGEIALSVMKGHATTAYGQVLDVLRVLGLSAQQIVDEISRPGIPRRLERASLGGFLNGGSPPLLQ
jgi:phage replication initiation protein